MAIRLIMSIILMFSIATTTSAANSEGFWSDVLDNHGTVMLLIEVDTGSIIQANKAAVSFYGYAREELVGMKIEHVNALSPSEIEIERRAAAREERNYFIFRHKLSSGELRTVEVYSWPVDDEGNLLYSIIIDITDRIVAETALIVQNQRLERAESIVSMGHWEFDLAANTAILSQGSLQVLGIDTSEVSLDYVRQELILPEYVDVREEALQQLITGEGSYDIQFKVRRPSDGRIADIRSTAEYDADRNVVFGTLVDVTEHSQLLALQRQQKVIVIIGGLLLFLAGVTTSIILFRLLRRSIEAEKKLKESLHLVAQREQDLAVTLQSIGDAVIATDVEGIITRLNPVAEKLTGYTANEALGKQLTDVFRIVNTKTRDASVNPVVKVLETGSIVGLANHTSLIAKDGKEYQIADSAAPIIDNEGEVLGVILVFHDVTEMYQQRAQLALSEEQFRGLFENSINAIALHELIVDDEGTPVDYVFLQANKAFEKHTDLCVAEILGKRVTEVHPDIDETHLITTYGEVVRTGKPLTFETYFDPAQKYYSISAYAVGSNQFAVVFEDTTARKESELRLRHLTFHDPVTGLKNRTFLEEKIKELHKRPQLPLSVIMADVNGLKLINDSLGHSEGDKVLKEIGEVLIQACREDDLVVRWGGDEFVVLLPNTAESKVREICSEIRRICQNRAEEIFASTLSFGYATLETSDQDIYSIMKQAEDYMYQRKMNHAASNRNALVRSLQRTLGEKSHETEEHARRMIDLSTALGYRLGLSEAQLDEISLLAQLHDIGKIAISERILNKPGPLSDEERAAIRKHPRIGSSIAAASPDLASVAQGILSHHERWDGKGYPRGLKEKDIPLSARIVAVVDAFEAMTSGRPYSKAKSASEALDEIIACSGTQFDPEVAEAFVSLLSESEAAAADDES